VKALSILIKVVGVIVFLLGAALAYNALSYINFDSRYGFLRLKQEAIATGWYLPAYYSHVLFGGLILMVGFFQLHPTWGHRWKKLHRAFGYFYVMGILFLSAPGGMVMSFFINRGPFVLLSFVAQCTLWFFCTAMAFDRIRKRDIEAHRQWMWRSFALTFAAITLRVYIFIVSFSVDLSQPGAYATLAWLSWVPNLIIAEMFIRSARWSKFQV
jgi:hypothetical protein